MTPAELLGAFSVMPFTVVSNVVIEPGCWGWLGRHSREGYGRFSLNGVDIGVHEYLYAIFIGSIPEGKQLDHFACDNRGCANPEHVRPATPRQNVLRGAGPTAVNARKTRCIRGHPFDNIKPGRRGCRRCDVLKTQRYRARRRTGGVA